MKHPPPHLGGHMNRVHTDVEILRYLIGKYKLKSFVDIGCGPGDMVGVAKDLGFESAFGIDGDFTLNFKYDVRVHDYCTGPYHVDPTDLGWSVEFLEHVDEQFQSNYMATFSACKYVICTAAPPGATGHHHVNCRDQQYWVEVFSTHGFDLSVSETEYIRANTSMTSHFMKKTGMFFIKRV